MFLCLLIIYCTLVIGGSEFFYLEGGKGVALGRGGERIEEGEKNKKEGEWKRKEKKLFSESVVGFLSLLPLAEAVSVNGSCCSM